MKIIKPGGQGMKIITNYRPTKGQRIKSFLMTLVMLAIAFLAGAAMQNTAHFLQDLAAAVPVALDGIKTFLRERFVFKVNALVGQLKWTAVVSLSILYNALSHRARSP
jgi:hypothetical protein